MATVGASNPLLSPSNSIRQSPSKVGRNRGSGELVEFCEDSQQGSKQYVRQEAAQDACGHDLLPPAPALTLPPKAIMPKSKSCVCLSTISTRALSASPPCPSPDPLDPPAPVGCGSSDGGGSSHAGSQPGTASSAAASSVGSTHDAFQPLGARSPMDPFAGEAAVQPFVARAGPLLRMPPEVTSLANEFSCERRRAISANDLLPLGEPLGAAELPGAAAAAARPPLPAALLVPPQPLEPPAPRRSAVDETDFVHVCLTPIRTRTDSADQGEPTPVSYADSLVPLPLAATVAPGLTKVSQSVRPTYHVYASAAATGPPGAYNPYDRTSMAAGYGGQRNYGYNYGCAPSGPPTTSCTSSYWASHQQRQHERKPAVPPAAAALEAAKDGWAPAASSEQGWWLASAPGGAAAAQQAEQAAAVLEEEVEHIVMVPGGVRHGMRGQLQQRRPQEQLLREPVEHIVMVPGRKAAHTMAAAASPAGLLDKTLCLPVPAPPAAGKVSAKEELVQQLRPAEAEPAAADGAVGVESSGANSEEGNNLLKQVLKVVLVAGVAVAASAPSKA